LGTAAPKKALVSTEDNSYLSKERRIAELAVQRVVLMTDKIFKELLAKKEAEKEANKNTGRKNPLGQHKTGASGESSTAMTKADDSPVTIADYAAQALLIYAMRKSFPEYGFLGEEDTKELRTKPKLLAEVVRLVNETELSDPELENLLGKPKGKEEILNTIDLGASTSSAEPGKRYIVMDPIDGTSAFLQGGQYAVVLGIIQDGQEIMGVAAGPNIKFGAVVQRGENIREDDIDRNGLGTMISAVRGHGATARRIGRGGLLPEVPLSRASQAPPRIDQRQAGLTKFYGLQYIDSQNSPKSRWDKVERFAGDYDNVVQLYSSHVRYMAMALGDRSYVQIRWPDERKKKFKPWAIWDHVGTPLIYTESGPGKVTDMHGKTLRYDEGRDMVSYYGIITADEAIHKAVLDAVKAEYAADKKAAELKAAEMKAVAKKAAGKK
jgi:3'(2'), 5'-bisphosphate nucleotidase